MVMPLIGAEKDLNLKELKGEVDVQAVSFPKELGEEHPFDFQKCENAYCEVGIIKAAVDKHVDFMISPGFYVTSKNEKAEAIINQFIQDTNFGLLLREFIREGLVKGNAFFEIGESKGSLQIKLLNASKMYLKRKITGEIESYKQYVGGDSTFNIKKVIDFKPSEIAHLAFDKMGDGAYGYGLVYPAVQTLNNFSRSDKDVHTVMKRKAGTPYHWKLGTEKEPVTQADIDNFTQRLTYLNNKQDWVTDHRAEAKILDFGNISDKFITLMDHDKEMLFYVFQIPPVIMGKSDVTTDPSEVQESAWNRRIQSLQANVEKVIEEKVFKRILAINGIKDKNPGGEPIDAHVELEWGLPDEKTINERILKITTLLSNPLISENMRRILEIDLANNLGYEEEAQQFFPKPSLEAEQERREEEELEQPEVPGEKNEKLTAQLKERLSKEELEKDYTLQEFVGFNYIDYKDAVLKAIKNDNFEDLLAKTAQERSLGLLTQTQVNELRNIIFDGFNKGKTIRMMAKDIQSKIKLKDRYAIDSTDGKKYLWFSKEERPILIARTESTRLANLGVQQNLEDLKIEEKSWVAVASDRTCNRCLAMDGQIVKTNEMFVDKSTGEEVNMPPLHSFCRCFGKGVNVLK